LPIEFRGYVAEEDIPDLYRTTSVVVLPYDSATGSSGPAHQACEFGVPVVSADIPDFIDMAADEDMAISFFRRGDAADLAQQLISILQSPELQRQMAEHNYAAGVRMTMSNVVRDYLRWFELHRRRRHLAAPAIAPNRRRAWLQSLFRSRGPEPDRTPGPAHRTEERLSADSLDFSEEQDHPPAFMDSRSGRRVDTSRISRNSDGYSSHPSLEGGC